MVGLSGDGDAYEGAGQKTRLSTSQHSPVAAKIALFRTLFRGRDDVYPRRFESRKTGKSGYAPACANEWVQGICEKPRIKCAVCSHRRFLPVTDDVIRWHLSGRDASDQPFVAGVYPMLLDETCYFLAVDFDKDGWQADSIAFLLLHVVERQHGVEQHESAGPLPVRVHQDRVPRAREPAWSSSLGPAGCAGGRIRPRSRCRPRSARARPSPCLDPTSGCAAGRQASGSPDA
jgi:hypothetical protein